MLVYEQPIKAAMHHPATARVAPFAVFVGLLGLASVLGWTGAVDADDLRWLHLARGAAAALLIAAFWRRYVELHASARCRPREWLIAFAAGLVVFVVWIQLDSSWAAVGARATGFDPTETDARIDPVLAGLRLASLALIVPVMEELFWRSFLLRWLDAPAFAFAEPRRTSARAFVLVAVMFALEHDLWLAGLFAGIVYNWLYVRTGSLWIPIASHAVSNGALGVWILATHSWRLW